METTTSDNLLTIDKAGLLQSKGKVLLADDSEPYTKKISDVLNPRGFETETVNSFAEMKQNLRDNKYRVNFVDNIEAGSKDTGSDIILQNPEMFGNDNKVFLVTAYKDRLTQDVQNKLAANGVEIIEKKGGFTDKLVKICDETFSSDADNIIKKTEVYFETLLEGYREGLRLENNAPYEQLIERTKIRLKSFINGLPDSDTPQFYVDGQSLSPKQIMLELDKKGSEIGALFIDILLDDVLEEDEDDDE